jgi:hypothetical protein
MISLFKKTPKPVAKNWKDKPEQKVTILSPVAVANALPKDQPFFEMRSGHKYAVKVARLRSGVEAPICFIRVDKFRGTKVQRKAMKKAKRTAKALAAATV